MRHRKSWLASSRLGTLKPQTLVPCGSMAPRTWTMVPSLPAVSNPCKQINSDLFPSEYKLYCRSRRRLVCFLILSLTASVSSNPSVKAGSILPSLSLSPLLTRNSSLYFIFLLTFCVMPVALQLFARQSHRLFRRELNQCIAG